MSLEATASISATTSVAEPSVGSEPSLPVVLEGAILGSIPAVWEQESITPILDLEAGLLKV